MRVFPIIEWLHILSATVLFGTGIGHGEHESEPDQTSKNVETGSALDVRGGNCEPILIPPLPRAGEGGEREKYRSRFASARLYGIHVPLAILVLYRVRRVSA